MAEDYHEDSKYQTYTLARLLAGVRSFEDWAAAQPFGRRASKAYPGAALCNLPRPSSLRTSLGSALTRRSSLPVGAGGIRQRALATILWAGQGLRLDGHRTAPSAGALYPLELYVLAVAVQGVAPGIHHYDPLRHCLEGLGPGSADKWYLDGQPFRDAAAHLVVTSVMPRLTLKYRERAYRFALQEAGHAAQNVLLATAALKLACTPAGGFYDDKVHDSLGVDGVEEIALYVLPLGRPESSGVARAGAGKIRD